MITEQAEQHSDAQWRESVDRISARLIGVLNEERRGASGPEVMTACLLALTSVLRAGQWENKPAEVDRLEDALRESIFSIDEWRKRLARAK